MVIFKRINQYLFYWGETINLAILCYFSKVLSTKFIVAYGIFLITLLIIKHFLYNDMSMQIDDITLLPISVFLMEFSLIFLLYTKININMELMVSLLGLMLLGFLLIYGNSIDSKTIYRGVTIFAIIAFIIGMILTFGLGKDKTTWLSELTKLLYILSFIFILEKTDSIMLLLIPLTIASLILAILLHEHGTMMVLWVSFAVYCLISNKRNIQFYTFVIPVY